MRMIFIRTPIIVFKLFMASVILLAIDLPVNAIRPPDRSPKIDSSYYWSENGIAIIEILGPLGGDHVPVKVIEQYTPDVKWKPPAAISISKTWIRPKDMNDPESENPKVQVGDHLLIGQNLKSPKEIAAIKFFTKDEEEQIAQACRAIKEGFNQTNTSSSLSVVVKSKNVVAQRLVLNSILSGDPNLIDSALVKQLAEVQMDKTAAIESRILACDIIERGRSFVERGEDWKWLAGILDTEKNFSREEYERVVDKMIVGHGDRRGETLELICKMANDAERPTALRLGIILQSHLTRILVSKPADEHWNVRWIDMLMNNLKDEKPEIRSAATNILWLSLSNMNASKTDADRVNEITEKGVLSLEEAITKEQIIDLKRYMMACKERIQRMGNE